MILYYYTDTDSFCRLVSDKNQSIPCVLLKFKHRSSLSDDPYNLFARYLLPRCIEQIEKEIGVDEADSLMPLFKSGHFMESVFKTSTIFNDRSTGLTQFVLSLYEDIDNMYLWLRYGDGGRGVTIGLDTDKLKIPFGSVFNSLIRKCNYWSKGIVNYSSQVDIPQDMYKEIKEVYQSMTNAKVKESFQKIYLQDTPEFAISQRIKETLLHNLINTFDLFHKCDDCRGEKEHRMTASVMTDRISYERNTSGDYDPFINVEFPIEALKMIVIGPKSGKNTYGMIKSQLYKHQVKEKIQILNSNCTM